MFGYTEAPRAWWMTRGMARLGGVRLSHAVVEGWLTRPELAVIVERCEACRQKGRCRDFLAEPRSEGAIAAFCPNRQALSALAPQ
ncbi:DUF6455 family protein [Pseudogemmobacter sonorensis]|uniref:DUF6455 family protein n=1 Tax=Pseudogemmobacter sonorensis TaxID=2989681 RepID=UPI003673A2C8